MQFIAIKVVQLCQCVQGQRVGTFTALINLVTFISPNKLFFWMQDVVTVGFP